ncbi:AmpG family muropeptide MFS transporter [Roseateles sp. BYS180W]|uniref:AmpG family muropeptide MFS transporter n=1 Tax=Roseateles rivi TaxID=3299028 RepID=A0ABW7FTH0_9BURK
MPELTAAPSPATAAPAPMPWPTRLWQMSTVLVLGVASGLPLALTAQALQAWMLARGLDLSTIGFLSLVGLPYTFKFLWAPLLDRYELPGLGRRRGWLVLTQLALAGALWALAGADPAQQLRLFALLALLVAFLSATQDVLIDAYRTELLDPAARGLGGSLNVLGYRLAMIFSGGVAFVWVDPQLGRGWDWPQVYRLMAAVMVGAAGVTALLLPRLKAASAQPSSGGHDLRGFAAVVLAVALGAWATNSLISPWLDHALLPLLQQLWPHTAAALLGKWLNLLGILTGLSLTLPLAVAAARWARYDTLRQGLGDYFAQPSAAAMLVLVVFYKLADAFGLALFTPFLIDGLGFGPAEVGVVNKIFGLWLSIAGALLGGLAMLRLGLWRALLLFGVLQTASNLGYWWLAVHGQGQFGVLHVPAFDLGLVRLAQATPLDGGLLLVVTLENLTGGMGTAALLALLMSLCRQPYTATQFALLSAFTALGRVWVGPMAGVLADTVGWAPFFLVSTLVGLPSLWMLWHWRAALRLLEQTPKATAS